MRSCRSRVALDHRLLLGAVALACTMFASSRAAAGGEGAIWTEPATHLDGLKVSLVSSTTIGTPTDAIRACFVLSNTNSPPGGALGSISPVSARITAKDNAGSGLPFEFSSPFSADVGGYPVACSVVLGSSTAVMVPVPLTPGPGFIPAGTVTNKCCFRIEAPAAIPRPDASRTARGATCDPAYPECFPGTGDELVYVLASDNPPNETSTETIYIWTLGAPGCGLIGVEVFAALAIARAARRLPLRSRGGTRGEGETS